jgi:hypothetical protein
MKKCLTDKEILLKISSFCIVIFVLVAQLKGKISEHEICLKFAIMGMPRVVDCYTLRIPPLIRYMTVFVKRARFSPNHACAEWHQIKYS